MKQRLLLLHFFVVVLEWKKKRNVQCKPMTMSTKIVGNAKSFNEQTIIFILLH